MKTYQIRTGDEFGSDFLPNVMAIDAACYPDEYVGVLENMVARFERNPRTFVCAMDGERLAGYINFFPTTDALWEEIVETGMDIRDDDIRPDEIPDYVKGGPNRIFIISIAIHPEYRKDKNVVITLTNGWIAYLNQLEAEGYPITAISATAVSGDGMKYLRTHMFRLIREIHDGNRVFVCDGDALKKLLANDLYFKTYRDDVYMLLPFAENANNPLTEKLFSPSEEGKGVSEKLSSPEEAGDDRVIPEKVQFLMSELDDCLRYECSNDVTNELERFFLGEFWLLQTTDEYPDEETGARPEIVGEETVYVSVLAHRPSHMYVVMLFIENGRFSTTQIEDQLFHGFLKIREKIAPGEPGAERVIDEKGYYRYQDLYQYLKENYGLLPCGAGKCMVCMSGKPKEEGEFYNILTGEVHNSMHQSFHINYPELVEQAKNNRAIYDYYDAYMSEKVIAFILRDFAKITALEDPTDWSRKEHFRERVKLAATYVFIMELVTFQNTALSKMTTKVSNALSQNGDVSYEYISDLYRDYALSVKFWQNDNFRYLGTQKEATQIRKAFGNDELREAYKEQQEFLENMVDLKNAQDERRNGNVINIVATFLAIMEVHEYLVELLGDFYSGFGIPVRQAGHSFTSMFIGGGILVLLVWYILDRKQRYERRRRMRSTYLRRVKKTEGGAGDE